MNGSRLDLDLGLNGGVVFAKSKEYKRVLNGNRYEYQTTKPENGYKLTFQPLIYAASTDVIRASLVYHFGPNVANKYKKRMMVDNNYCITLANLKLQRDSINEANKVAARARRDSLEKVDYEKRFEQQRLENEKRYANDSIKAVKLSGEKTEIAPQNDANHEVKSMEEQDSAVSMMIPMPSTLTMPSRKMLAYLPLQTKEHRAESKLHEVARNFVLPEWQLYLKRTKHA